jgi:hypothetical protein
MSRALLVAYEKQPQVRVVVQRIEQWDQGTARQPEDRIHA